jgi:thiol-disulfide isomerase/thioredoxin
MEAILALALALALAACGGSAAPAGPPRHPSLALIERSRDLDRATVGRGDAAATVAFVFASWCAHCRRELDVLRRVLEVVPNVRVLGINYRGHEEYDGRGGAAAVRAYVARHAPWLHVVPAGEALFDALGRPPKVPTIYIYDAAGALAARYDRRERALPDEDELARVLQELSRRAHRRR